MQLAPPVPIKKAWIGQIYTTDSGLWVTKDKRRRWKFAVTADDLERLDKAEKCLLIESGIFDRRFRTLKALQVEFNEILGRPSPLRRWKTAGMAETADGLFFFNRLTKKNCDDHAELFGAASPVKPGWTIAQTKFPAISKDDPLTKLLCSAGIESQQTSFPTLLEARRALGLVWHPQLSEQLGL